MGKPIRTILLSGLACVAAVVAGVVWINRVPTAPVLESPVPGANVNDETDGRDQAAAIATDVVYVDVARERGLTYPAEQPRPMRVIGLWLRVCRVDCDDDGWQDILLVGDPHPSLFHNLGNVSNI